MMLSGLSAGLGVDDQSTLVKPYKTSSSPVAASAGKTWYTPNTAVEEDPEPEVAAPVEEETAIETNLDQPSAEVETGNSEWNMPYMLHNGAPVGRALDHNELAKIMAGKKSYLDALTQAGDNFIMQMGN